MRPRLTPDGLHAHELLMENPQHGTPETLDPQNWVPLQANSPPISLMVGYLFSVVCSVEPIWFICYSFLGVGIP